MKLTMLLIGFLLSASLACKAQLGPVDMEKIDSLMIIDKKPILILLTAPWCKYCHVQVSQLKSNRKFISGSGSFYFSEFDAESTRQPISFNGKTYTYDNSGSSSGVNRLAEALNGSARLSYPTWIVMDPEYRVLARYHSVLDQEQLNTLVDALKKYN